MGRYCSYLLPKQTGGTTQILIFETLRMIGRFALYFINPSWEPQKGISKDEMFQ